MLRYITLCDGTTMDDELLIIRTNAPVELLKDLENKSNEVYVNGGDETDVPDWVIEVVKRRYVFICVASCKHVNSEGTSNEWLENHEIGKNITEHYVIENQPE